VRVNVAADPPTITKLKPAGAGGWYDWAYHPQDGRLYAVDGDDGSLLHLDQSADPLKKVLVKGCFPKAEAPKQGERGLYSAVFFNTAGHLYAVDTAGNVNKLDLTASTQSKPLTGDDLRETTSTRVGGGKIQVDDLQVQDSAGQVLHQEIPEQYDRIGAEIKPRDDHPYQTNDPAPGWDYSYRLTLTARQTDVRKWRVTFDLPAHAQIKTWGMSIEHHDGHQAYLHSQEDRLIPAGKSQIFDFILWVPKDEQLPTMELRNVHAVRLG
jgi:hypothetical protein